MQSLESIIKVGAVTAAGAFFGALTLTTFPTTLDEWKHVIVPALGAAVAAELSYLRTQGPSLRDAILAEIRSLSPQLATALTQAVAAMIPPPPALPPAGTTTSSVTATTTTTEPISAVVVTPPAASPPTAT